FVATLERRQGFKICCPEEIAYRMGFIDKTGFKSLADGYGKSAYGTYLKERVLEDLESINIGG
ncbi:glucose-1-phosphate thymidylyltransferase, partial [Agrobacterium sp. Ap1]|nr:glucose-1-phosphate thymidylyltransferase [Agrobacterium sp. Ap1]